MLCQCWATVGDGGPTLKQHWVNASCLLGYTSFLNVQTGELVESATRCLQRFLNRRRACVQLRLAEYFREDTNNLGHCSF